MKIAASDFNHCSFLAAGYELLQRDHAEVALWEFSKRVAQRAIHLFGYSRMKAIDATSRFTAPIHLPL